MVICPPFYARPTQPVSVSVMNQIITKGRVERNNCHDQHGKDKSAYQLEGHQQKFSQENASSRLKKWGEYESMLREDKKRAYRQLKQATGAYKQAIVESNDPNIAVPILLSMVIELRSQLERVEDEVEVLRIKNKADNIAAGHGNAFNRSRKDSKRKTKGEGR